MKRIIIILFLLLVPIADSISPLVDNLSFGALQAASLTPQQKAAKKRAAAKQKAAKKRAAAKKKAAKKKAKAKQQAAKQKAKQQVVQPQSDKRTTEPSPNNVIAWGEVGYSALFSTLDQAKTKGGVGGGIGLGYELDYNRWLLVAGVEFTYLTSTTTLPNYTTQEMFTYTPAGSKMTYTHNYSDIRYYDQVGLVQIPLRFGYRFTDNWYGLLGLNFGIGVLGNSKYSVSEYVYARDDHFAEDFHDIGHLTGTTDYSAKENYSFGCTIGPAVEVGYQFNQYVRLGLFAEYGFNLGDKSGPAKMNSDLLVGARVTAQFNLPKRVKKPEPVEKLPEIQEPIIPVEPEIPEPSAIEPEPEPIFFGDQEVVADKAIILDNLLFVFDKADIIPESTEALDNLLVLMQEHPDMIINIIGHTDIMGSAAYNQRLSERRAKAVKDYLVQHGIEAYRMEYEGRGATEPIDTNDTEQGRQHNRRVEFIIL